MPDETNTLQRLIQQAKALQDSEFNTATQDLPQPDASGFTKLQNKLSPESYKQRQERKLGAPLDTETGAPFLQRVGAAFRTEPEQVVKYWQDLYGKENVRLLDGGDVAVRVLGDDGNPKFMAINEDKLTLKDMDKVAGIAPEIIGTYLGVRSGGKVLPTKSRFWTWAKELTGGSIGGEAAGAVKDMAVRDIDQMPIQPGTVLENRAMQVPADMAIGAGLSLGTKILGKIVTPFGGEIPAIQFDANEAKKYWEAKGVKLPYSSGEKTGSIFLQRSEAELKKLPGASGPFDDLRAQQQAAIQKMQDITQGVASGVMPSVEAVNERVQRVLRNELEPQEQLIRGARSKLVQEAHDDAMRIIGSQTLPARMDYADDIGRTIRQRVLADRADFTAQSKLLYDAARALPGGSDRILAPGNIAKQAADYLEKLPSKDVITDLPTGILGPGGQPILRTETGKEVFREFVPSGVVSRLQSLAASGDTKFSLQDLISMRTDVRNAIAEGEAIKGVQTHHLGQIADMLTGAIKKGVDSIPDKSLKSAYEAAETHYRNGVERFHTRLIGSILKEPTAPGAIGDAKVFDRVASGEDSIAELKNFLGADSSEYKMLKRGIADEIYRKSMYPGQDLLNAKTFLSKLDALRKDQPKVFDEVFGTRGGNLLQAAQLMTIGQADKIESAVLDQAMANPRAIPNLRALIDAQREQDKLYKNKILKAIGSDTLPGEGIEPSQFLNRFVDSAAPEQVTKVMSMLESADPEAARIMRAKAVQKLLSEAGRKPGPMDRVALLLDDSRVVNTEALQGLLRDPEKKKVYTALIGNDGMEMLDMLAKAVKPIESKERAFAAAGGISAGMQIAKFWQGGLLGFADKAVHNLAGGFLLTTPGLRNYVGNNLLTPDRMHSLLKMTLYSEPAVKAFGQDYGEQAPQIYQRLNDAIDGSLGLQMQQATNQPPQQDLQKALQLLDSIRKRPTPASR